MARRVRRRGCRPIFGCNLRDRNRTLTGFSRWEGFADGAPDAAIGSVCIKAIKIALYRHHQATETQSRPPEKIVFLKAPAVKSPFDGPARDPASTKTIRTAATDPFTTPRYRLPETRASGCRLGNPLRSRQSGIVSAAPCADHS